MNNSTRYARLDDLLRTIPKFECVEGCSDCCGPITMTPLEWKRIIERTGDHKLKDKMAALIEAAFQGGRDHCPLLNPATHRCTVYDIRPAICVLYGAGKGDHLECPHGRQPEKPLTYDEFMVLMSQVDRLGLGRPSLYLKKI